MSRLCAKRRALDRLLQLCDWRYRRCGGRHRESSQRTLVPTERELILLQAMKGDPSRLNTEVDSQNQRFSQDAEALLILARALAKRKNFASSRIYYSKYLVIKPDDFEIFLESLYTHVWEGQSARALQQLDQAAPSLTQPPERQLAFKSSREFFKNRAAQEAQKNVDVAGGSRNIATDYEYYQTSDSLSRHTTSLGVNYDAWRGNVRAHNIKSEPFQTEIESTVSEASLQFRQALNPSFSLVAQFGVFAAETNSLIVDSLLLYSTPDAGDFGVGVFRQPFAKYMPLETAEFDLMDQAGYAVYSYERFLNYRYEFHQFEDYFPYEKHKLTLTLPMSTPTIHRSFDFRIGMERESHDRPHPLIYSPKAATLIYVGPVLTVAVNSRIRLLGELDVGLVLFETRAQPGEQKNIQYYRVAVNLDVKFTDTLSSYLAAEISETKDQELMLSTYKSKRGLLGLRWDVR